MAEVVNGQHLNVEARFQSRANPRLICDEKSGSDRGFQRVYSSYFRYSILIHPSQSCKIPEIDSAFKQHTK
jgi:hypothetical protein